MNTPQKIGKVIKDLRIARGLSQEQLSLQSGIDQHYVSNIENGQRNPSVEMIERLATFFGFTLSRFFVEIETLEESSVNEPSHVFIGNSEAERFSEYMLSRKLSGATAKKYSENVPNCINVRSIIRNVTNGRTDDMYQIREEGELEMIIQNVADSEFDKVGQRMYSCGLKKYLQYLRYTR